MTSRVHSRALVGAAAFAVLALAGPAGADEKDVCIDAAARGQVLRDQGKLLAARESFLVCSRAACPSLVRTDCAGWLSETDARIPSVVIGAQDPEGRDTIEARLSMDGSVIRERLDAGAISVDPGAHVLRFERAGSAPVELRVVLREGERRRALSVRFRAPGDPGAPEPRAPSLVPVFVLGGVGLTGVAAFAILGVGAKADVDRLRATCAPDCAPSDVESARRRAIAANISLGVGAAAIGAAVIVLLARPRAATKAPAVAIHPIAGGGAASIAGSF